VISIVGEAGVGAIDLAIVGVFLVLMAAIGLVMSKAAGRGMEDYFLGGNKLPWWLLGVSSAASNFDMAGTMIIVAVVFGLGFKGFLVEIRGGVGLTLAFLMVFLGKWLRRSRVMTSAEWMKIRFGTDRQGRAAHLLSAVANLVLSLGMIIYFSKGAGKFLTHFLPFSELACTSVMVGIGLFYTLAAGLYGVVFTDLIQMVLVLFTAVYVVVVAAGMRGDVVLPDGFFDFNLAVPEGLGQSLVARDPQTWGPIFGMFGVVVVMWVVRTTLEGMGGVGGYTDQRFFAARSERDASLLTLESIVLSVFRWAMVAGLVIMGYHLVQTGGTGADIVSQDAEQVLPVVLTQLLPTGVRGLVVTGLVAAAMSTFDSTLNAGASYLVRDIYQTYIRPDADGKALMRVSRWATLGLCVAGVGLAAVVPDINQIWSLITMGIGAGLFVPLFLRWYWPRFNGYGFAAGTGGGLAAALVFDAGLDLPLYVSFPCVIGSSLALALAGSLLTQPTHRDVLVRFWLQINPWGMWGQIASLAHAEGRIQPGEIRRRGREKLGDILALICAIPFQICLLLFGMSLVFQEWAQALVCGTVVACTGVALYFLWYRSLPRSEQDTGEPEHDAQAPGHLPARGQGRNRDQG